MKKIILFIAIIFSVNISFAQVVKPEDAIKHIGEVVKVCGKVYGGRFFETSKDSPTLLNLGAAWPLSTFTIMIPKDIRTKMGNAPEIELKEKNVCVTGKVILYKEKAEIIVDDAAKLTVEK